MLLLQRSRTKAKRLSGSRSQLSPKPRPKSMSQQLPSQSCPSPSPPPVLVKQLDPAPAPALETSRQHHRSGSSHRSRKDHGSSGRRPGSGLEKRSTPVTHKKDLSSIITQDQETLSGSDKEEVSITNNLHGILLKKRETPNFAKSCKISKIYSGRLPGAGDKSFSKKKQMNTFRSSNCDSNICDNSREYDSMPTLHNYTGIQLLQQHISLHILTVAFQMASQYLTYLLSAWMPTQGRSLIPKILQTTLKMMTLTV